MSFKVTFTKGGKVETRTFHSESIARTYAAGVRGTVTSSDTECKQVSVVTCPEGTAERQREAAKDYYATTKAGFRYVPRDQAAPENAERRAEAMAEHFMECRTLGASQADAWADWDHTQGA